MKILNIQDPFVHVREPDGQGIQGVIFFKKKFTKSSGV
jgi:hypothetical protein